MKILPAMPCFETRSDRLAFGYLLAGVAATISGSWFAQIAYFSIIFKKSGLSSPVAIYFLCTYLPVTILAWRWHRLVSRIGLRSVLLNSQLLATVLTILQIATLVKPHFYLFFGVTFLKGFCSSTLYLAYDTLIAKHFRQSSDVHRANVLLNAARYGGLIIFPILGGYCSEMFGNSAAIMVDGLSSLVALMFFLKMPSDYYNVSIVAEPQKSDLHKGASRRSIGAFIVPFLNQFSYGIFNYLMPVYLLLHLNIERHAYGWTMALSGAAFLLSALISLSQLISNTSSATLKLLSIISTILNGIFLYMAFTTLNLFSFNAYMFLASAISLISITCIKTLLMGNFRQMDPKLLSGHYNTSVWFGSALGYIFCAAFGNYVSPHTLAICILSTLAVSSLIIVRELRFTSTEEDHEALVKI